MFVESFCPNPETLTNRAGETLTGQSASVRCGMLNFQAMPGPKCSRAGNLQLKSEDSTPFLSAFKRRCKNFKW